ncbi:hypothetical protein ES705_30799 [subsurface metagenome]
MKKLIFILLAILFSFSSCKFVKEKGWFGLKNADTMETYLRKQDSIHIADSISKVIAKQRAN